MKIFYKLWKQFKRIFQKYEPNHTTNFVIDPVTKKNGILQGTELIVKIEGAEVVTGRIYDHAAKLSYPTTTSHSSDADHDAETITITLKSHMCPNTEPPDYWLPKGKYTLLTWWWNVKKNKGGQHKETFLIY